MKVSKMSDIILLIKTNIEEYVLIAHFKVHVWSTLLSKRMNSEVAAKVGQRPSSRLSGLWFRNISTVTLI